MGRGYRLDSLPQAVFAPQTGRHIPDKIRGAKERDLLCYRSDNLPMKKLTLLGAFALFATSIGAQSPALPDQKQLETLLKTLQAQQIQIAENQAKIDAKLVALSEAIRVAKIYSSRGGR